MKYLEYECKIIAFAFDRFSVHLMSQALVIEILPHRWCWSMEPVLGRH